MTSPAASHLIRRVLIPAAFVLFIGVLFGLLAPSFLTTWPYAVYVEGTLSPEARESLSQTLADRVRLFPHHFRVSKASLAVSEDGTYTLIVRSREDPADFVAAMLSPNVRELREARRAEDGADPLEGFYLAVLPTPEYDMMKFPERNVREQPIFLSQSPGMTLRKVASVKMWTAKTTTRDPVISLEFLEEDAPRFADLTGRLAQGPDGTMLAMLIDGKVITAGIVDDRIEGGRVELRDVATKEDAALIAAMIEAGPLPPGVILRAEEQPPPTSRLPRTPAPSE